jgi:PAS domain S-box-containing protein
VPSPPPFVPPFVSSFPRAVAGTPVPMSDSDASGGRSPGGSDAGKPHRSLGERDAASYAQAGGGAGIVTQASGLFQLLVESVRDYAIFALDPTGVIMSWNAGAERIKGYRADEIIGRHFSVFYPEAARSSGFPDYELEVARDVGRFEDEGWRVRKDGTQFWANVVITALHADDGTLMGFAKVTRDLTERRLSQQREIEDTRRIAESEAANRAKTGFLAAMSHELRTPLNAIAGYAQLMQEGIAGPTTELQQEYLSRIRGSQVHLLGIVNDLLNYGRIEAGELTYDLASISLQDVGARVLAMVAPQADRKQLRLAGPDAPLVSALADQLKTEQIVLNLVSNAVKFTPEGGVVTLACALRDGAATIEVRDTGPGIPDEMQEMIFDPFVQLGRSLTNTQEGAGLGLAISRDLARAMNGDVTVQSTPGSGSTFTLRLPAA